MPPVDYPSSGYEDSDSNEPNVAPRKPEPAKASSKVDSRPKPKDVEMRDDEKDEDEDEEDDEDDGAEAEFIVEEIKSHEWKRGSLLYHVKWEGWPEADNTWEPEINLEDAKEILEAYFAKIGGRPQPKKPGKKRGRQSAPTTADTSERSGSKRTRTGPGRRSAGARAASVDVSEREPDPWPKRKNPAWTPPKPLPGSPGSWEDLLLKVETVMVDEHGGKWAYLQWVNEDEVGTRVSTKARLETVHMAAPRAMLAFYESHLVFTNGDKQLKAMNNGDRSVKPNKVDNAAEDIEE